MATLKWEKTDRSDCVRELFPDVGNCDVTAFTQNNYVDYEAWRTGDLVSKPELDSFIFSCETIDDLIPELSYPSVGEPLVASSPKRQRTTYGPLTIEIPHQTVLPPSKTGGTVSVNCNINQQCQGLLKIATGDEEGKKPVNRNSDRRFKPCTENVTCGQKIKGRRRKRRTIYSPDQLEILEGVFAYKRIVSYPEIEQLSLLIGIPTDVIMVWFQNRRSKERRRARVAAMLQEASAVTTPMCQTTTGSNTVDWTPV